MTNVSQVLLSHYRSQADQVCLYLQHAGQADQPITYASLLEGSIPYAQLLDRQGIQPGEVVILILQHGRDLVSAFFGCILHGAVPSILPFLTEKLLPDRYRSDLAALIGVTRPAALVTYPQFESEVRSALHAGDSVRAVLLSNDAGEPARPDLDDLAGLGRPPEDIVLLQHSSGTTGLQKGVALSHQAVLNQLDAYRLALHTTPGDTIVSWLPLYHDMGLIAGFLLPVLSGIPLVLMSPFDWVRAPQRLMQAISEYGGTLCWLPNFAYNFCAQKIRDKQLEGVSLTSLRAVINCSEPMRAESHQLFLKKFSPYGFRNEALASSYAMAENVFAVTQGGIDQPLQVDEIDREAFQVERLARPAFNGRPSIRIPSAGKPLHNTQVCILSDDEQRLPLPDRQVGEIAIQSNCLLTGYYHRPDLTEEVFHQGWFLTGDYGYMVNGEVYVSGRKKEILIVGGRNIYPGDLEELAMEVAGVHPGRVVAFGIFNEQLATEDVVLAAEVNNPDPGQRAVMADLIRQRVTRGSAVALRHVHLVDPGWLIKTSSGKNARSLNRQKFLDEQALED